MFNLIKSGVKTMAIIEFAEGCIKGVGNTIKDPHARKVVGVIVGGLGVGLGVGLGGGLIASSYV